ncbi:ankyrin-3 [Hordeum vulgare]|nr:ankyrin-3 [Hordeum vulgare]
MERCTQPRSLPFGFFFPRAAGTDEEEEAEEGGRSAVRRPSNPLPAGGISRPTPAGRPTSISIWSAAAARSKVQAFLEAACSGDLEALRSRPPAPAPLLTCLASSLLLLVLVAEFGSALDEEGKGVAAVAAGMRDANKRTALHFAAREGRTEVSQFLVEQLRLPVDPKDDDCNGSLSPYPHAMTLFSVEFSANSPLVLSV